MKLLTMESRSKRLAKLLRHLAEKFESGELRCTDYHWRLGEALIVRAQLDHEKEEIA